MKSFKIQFKTGLIDLVCMVCISLLFIPLQVNSQPFHLHLSFTLSEKDSQKMVVQAPWIHEAACMEQWVQYGRPQVFETDLRSESENWWVGMPAMASSNSEGMCNYAVMNIFEKEL